MTDPIRPYLDAKKQFDAAADRLSQTVKIIIDVGDMLKKEPDKFSFSNSLPISSSAQKYTLDANRWPSAEKLQKELIEWHSTKFILDQAWSVLSQDDKSGLQPPQELRKLRFSPG